MEAGGSLLRNGRFVRLWIGQGISFVGDAVSAVALVILVIQITGSGVAVGGVLLLRLLPTLAGPLVGVRADRLPDRRAVLVACDLLRAALAVALIFAQDLASLYVVAFLMGAATTFFNPTIRAAFPGVVGDGDLTRANALISGTFSVSVTVGPALGGLLVALVGVDAAFALDAATFLVSALFLALVALPRPPRTEEGSFFREMAEGFAYLSAAPVALGLVVGAFLTVLTANVTVPAEAFLAKDTFGAGDLGYGLLVSVWGGGMVLGSALMAALGDRAGRISAYFAAVFLTAVGLAATGLAPTFAVALAVLLVAGLANGVDNVVMDTVLQKRVPEALLGRVFAARFLAFSLGEGLAYAAGGLLVEAAGPRNTYLLAGVATFGAGLVVLLIVALVPAKSPKDPA